MSYPSPGNESNIIERPRGLASYELEYPCPVMVQPPSVQPPSVQPAADDNGRGSLAALVASSAVLVLIVAGLAGLYLIRQDNEAPVAPANAAEYPARIVLPKPPATLAGLTMVRDPELTRTANDTATRLKTSTNADGAVAAYYAPNGDLTRTVGLAAVTTQVRNPGAELRTAFSSTLAMSDVAEVDPGPLGGIMRCGNTSTGGVALTACGWADGGSLALGIFLNRSLADSAALLRRIRGEVLRRG